MKRKIRIVGFDKKVIEKEITIPNKFHFDAQLKFRSNVYKPKKGKGSYSRKIKHKNYEEM